MPFDGVLGPAPHRMADPGAGELFLFRTSARGAAGRFSFEWHLAPGFHGPGEHAHPNESETFRILSGRLVVVLEGARHALGPGDTFTVPAGVVHHFEHPGNEELVAEVTLSGTWMEDQVLPICVRFGDPERRPVTAMPQFLVHLGHWMQQGANVPHSAFTRLLMNTSAATFRIFGLRPLPPVQGWDEVAGQPLPHGT